MRRVIDNSTPIIVLSHIGQLDLLKKLYTKVYIPRAVYNEVSKKKDIAGTALESSLNWIIVSEISSAESYPMYKAKLHAGEVDVMILAQEDPKSRLAYH